MRINRFAKGISRQAANVVWHVMPRSLLSQLIVMLTLSWIVAFSAYFSIVVSIQKDLTLEPLHKSAISVAQNVAVSLKNEIASGDIKSLEKELNNYVHLANIHAIEIYNIKNELLTVTKRDIKSEPYWYSVVDRILFTEKYPIRDTSSIYGFVKVAYVTDEAAKGLISLWQNSAIFASIFSILVIILSRMLVSRPLKSLLKATSLAEQLEDMRGEQVEIERSSEEVEKLITALNSASSGLAERDRTITSLMTEVSYQKEKAETTLESISDGVMTVSSCGHVEYMNPASQALLRYHLEGYDQPQLREIFDIVNNSTGQPITQDECVFADICTFDESFTMKKDIGRVKTQTGEYLIVNFSISPIVNRFGVTKGAVVAFRDITEQHHLNKKIEYQASHDALTGLINRTEFKRRAEELIRTCRIDNSVHALAYLDLDQFKIVNDTCGHTAGDELLKGLSSLLKSKLRGSDTLARLGGDEFGVLFTNCDIERAESLCNKLIETVQDYRFQWKEKTFGVGVSIGLVSITQETESLERLTSTADIACYAAKDGGRNRVHVFNEETEHHIGKAHEQMNWHVELQNVFDEGRFVLFSQDICPLDGSDEAHHEVLVRIKSREGDIIPPGAFLPAAERYGLMCKLDRHVVEHAFKAISELNLGVTHVFCINLSATTITDKRFADFVIDAIERYGINPEQICFELTETAAVSNIEVAQNFMQRMRNIGIKIALDDFGNGAASFNYLKAFEVDYVKIDGSFVKDVETDAVDREFVRTINNIGHLLGVRTVAEFVESQKIMDYLREIEVDFAQGYHIGKPHPIEDLKK